MRRSLFILCIFFSFSSSIKAELLITQANIHVGDGTDAFTADILIKDGVIQRIATNISAQSNWEIIDAGGLNVTPGLISPTSNLLVPSPVLFALTASALSTSPVYY